MRFSSHIGILFCLTIVAGGCNSVQAQTHSVQQDGEGQLPASVVAPEDAESKYFLENRNGELVATSELPVPKEEATGEILLETILRPGEAKGTLRVVQNGYVWTAPVSKIGALDLTNAEPLSTQEGFSLEDLRKDPAVIPFKNGYAVNLWGAKVRDGYICAHIPKQAYKTASGQVLLGRLFIPEAGRIREVLLRQGVYASGLPGELERKLWAGTNKPLTQSKPVIQTDSTAKISGMPIELEGNIIVVNKEFNFAVINLGSKDGVIMGMEFEVYHNNSYIGDVKVEQLHDAVAAAGFLGQTMMAMAHEGDRVVTKMKNKAAY